MICTECGREIGDNHKFCKYCGAPAKQVILSTENSRQAKKCRDCGATLNHGTAFCTQCGTPVSAAGINVSATKEKNKPQGGKAGKIVITVITIIALVLVAFVGYYFADQYGMFERDTQELSSEVTEDNETVYEEEEPTEMVLAENGELEEPTEMVSGEDIDPEEPNVSTNADVIDVEAIVLQIRDKYNKIVDGIASSEYDITLVDEGIIAYSEQEQIKAIVVKKDYDEGNVYNRNFYYDGDKLFFAYYEGSDSHRLYYDEDQLIRWRYCSDAEDNSKAINYDLENTSEYYRWENDVIAESNKLLSTWEGALVNGTASQEYILTGSDSRYILKSEIQDFTAEQCRLARNEIYARHGRIFDDEYLQEYFNSKGWYTPTVDSNKFEESMLNSYEIANRDLIVEYEVECGYR